MGIGESVDLSVALYETGINVKEKASIQRKPIRWNAALMSC